MSGVATTSPDLTEANPLPKSVFGYDVSFDDGRTWVDARKQSEDTDVANRFHSYWMPIPAGATRVRFRGQAASGMAGWFVRDVSVWAGG